MKAIVLSCAASLALSGLPHAASLSAPTSMPAACAWWAMSSGVWAAASYLRRWFLRWRWLMMFGFSLVRMTGQPPNTMSQSPERGRQGSLRSRAATNGRLAGAAAMLTHGVAIVSRHHWQSGLLPRHAHRDFTTPPAPANHSCASPASPCYSLAVKSSAACSGANHEHRSETRAKPPRRKEKTI